MSNKTITHLAFIDVETTGLDKQRDPIIEIAIVLTDMDLNRVTVYSTPILTGKAFLESRFKDNDYVREMHTKNGLLSCLESDTKWPTLEETEYRMTTILARYTEPGAVMIAGSGVAQFDQQVLRIQMPALDQWFAYYPMDVGVIRRFIKNVMRRDDLLLPEVESVHRALDDVNRALTEARHYREILGGKLIPALDEER